MKRTQLLGCALAALVAPAVSAQGLDMDWFTCDGGGGTSTDGTLTLSGSIGQAEPGTIAGGGFELTGGFWLAMGGNLCPEDLNDNLNVDFADILLILSQWGPCVPSCVEDLSGNGNVDFADILIVLGAWGPCPE